MLKKKVLIFLLAMGIALALVSCANDARTDDNSYVPGDVNGGIENEIPLDKLYMYDEEMNPKYDSRTIALDTIFNPDELGQMVLVIDRSEWNKHLEYCDINLDHEEMVVAKGFYFTKDNKEWFFKDVGFRIRGNTSRIRPQEKKSDGKNGKYVQAHFSLDFEEWLTEEQEAADIEKKLANSMKGLILKRFKDDPTYCREVYGYNMFRQCGIWIAPRAAYTRLIIQIQEDDGSYETVNYGVYAMIEEIKKQFLKERTAEEGGGELNSNKGNLWKLSWGADFKDFNSIGEESSEKIVDSNGKVTDIKVQSFAYDYKGDNEFDDGKNQLLSFADELKDLPDCTDGNNDDADIETIKTFYTEKMDGDLFLRTYAVNVILGMWDDYWVNKNNYYFYFDKNGKAYFIPYDYDNILGINGCGVDAGTHNPIQWGSLTDGSKPLIQKILQVPEYMEAYKKYLDEYSNEDSYFDDDASIARIKKWHDMFRPYVYSEKLNYNYSQYDKYFTATTPEIKEGTISWSDPKIAYTIFTSGNMNYFTVRQNTIKDYLGTSGKLVLTLDAGKGFFCQNSSNYKIKSYAYTFEKGDSLQKILNANGFNGWKVWYNNDNPDFLYGYKENEIYYYPDWFCYKNGDLVSETTTFSKSTTLYSLYRRFYTATLDLNGGSYNGSTDSVNKLIPEVYYISRFGITPVKNGYTFGGWTNTKDGTEVIDRMPSEDSTFYAYWISLDSIYIPYAFNEDGTITFTFRPEYFNVTVNETNTIYLMSSNSNWKADSKYQLTKQDDGTYQLTLNWENDAKSGFDHFNGYKFFVNNNWVGYDKYKGELPNSFAYYASEHDNQMNFKILY